MTPGGHEERWYLCEIQDSAVAPDEPDWSRVPEQRRALVRERWLSRSRPDPEQWKLWGPQIAHYQARPDMEVTVLRPVEQ